MHPVHTEAVSGIVGRGDVMATVFFLSAFLLLRRRVRFADERLMPALGWSVLAALLWLGGLLSKEIAATLPLVLAVDDWLARREFPDRARTIRMLLVRYVPLVAAAIVYLLLRQNAVAGGSQIWPGFADVSTVARILTASRVMMEYIGLFIFPRTLLADYWKTDVPIATSLADPLVLLSFLLWTGVAALAFTRLRRDRAHASGAAHRRTVLRPARAQ